MTFVYLFEAKSIQAYLFKSGKLKDVIAASERLDSFIDDNKNSLLYSVLTTNNLPSDLITEQAENSNKDIIQFLRAKGGAFYAYSSNKDLLVTLRSAWTLTIQQLFPSLEFTDGLTESENLIDAVKLAHQILANNRNTPSMVFPMATTIMELSDRTGKPSVPLSNAAKNAIADSTKEAHLDIDTELHRQAYQNLNMSHKAALQGKFTPQNLADEINYPIDLENDFLFAPTISTSLKKEQKEVIKDIALVHIDGNGLGIILQELQQALKNADNDTYRKSFRMFSSALADATQQAAKQATAWLFDQASYVQNGKTYIPMRPIVLGGDDVTLICRADLALEYSKRFCRYFKEKSAETLKPLFTSTLKSAETLKPYLTASGGILYHKASHPFTHSHHLVEGLCAKAKILTKSIDANVGPAALAFHRLSNSSSASIETLIEQSQVFSIKHNNQTTDLTLGHQCYLVDDDNNQQLTFTKIEKCLNAFGDNLSKFRQMTTHIAMNNKYEADLVFSRMVKNNLSNACNLLASFNINQGEFTNWYWQETNTLQTVIADLLTLNHYQPILNNVNIKEEA